MRQYFFQALFHRALREDDEIPPLDDIIKRYIQPEVIKFELTEPLMK
jgi:hypothetical protein